MAIPQAQQPIAVIDTVFHVTRHSTNWIMRKGEVTTSAAGAARVGFPGEVGGTSYAPVTRDPQWRVEFPHDDASFVEALGLEEGNIIAQMWFFHATTKADRLCLTFVDGVEKMRDSANDVVRVVVTGSGGRLTKNLTPPVIPPIS